MTLTDPIADMLTRLRNAQTAGKETVSMPTSKKLVEIARIMEQEGYIRSYEVTPGEPRDILELTLKYGPRKAKTIRGIRRISTDESAVEVLVVPTDEELEIARQAFSLV